MTFIQEYAIGQFGKKVVSKLAKKGIRIIGTQSIPNEGSWINAEVAYQIDDNGTGKCIGYFDVLKLAA